MPINYWQLKVNWNMEGGRFMWYKKIVHTYSIMCLPSFESNNYCVDKQLLTRVFSLIPDLSNCIHIFSGRKGQMLRWSMALFPAIRSIWSDDPISRMTSFICATQNINKSLLNYKSVLWCDNTVVKVWLGFSTQITSLTRAERYIVMYLYLDLDEHSRYSFRKNEKKRYRLPRSPCTYSSGS